ncbi:MAG: hypothetical protein KC421_20520 [Anaerolineales bacterium]|nr:hypothetical protein [Anaerolineales bacterium]
MYEGLPFSKALLTAVTGGLFLGLVGMTVANVTQNTLVGYGAGIDPVTNFHSPSFLT